MNKRDVYKDGMERGKSCASWTDEPIMGDDVPRDLDWVGYSVVTPENFFDVWTTYAQASESNSRDYSPFEVTAHAINECHNAEELWEAFDAGIERGIALGLQSRIFRNFTEGLYYPRHGEPRGQRGFSKVLSAYIRGLMDVEEWREWKESLEPEKPYTLKCAAYYFDMFNGSRALFDASFRQYRNDIYTGGVRYPVNDGEVNEWVDSIAAELVNDSASRFFIHG